MFKLLKDAFKVKSIRNQILFTLALLCVFRIGAHITVPGVNASKLTELSGNPLFEMLNLVSGSGMTNFSLFALGVSPYITASIIVQLLQMDIVPSFTEWSKQGETGRTKLNQATRVITLVVGFAQSMAITVGFNNFTSFGLVESPTLQTFITIGILLTGGTMFVSWLGEQITDKGLGNGTSLIIFSGIVSGFPAAIQQIIDDYFINVAQSKIWMSVIFVVILVLVILLIVIVATYFQQADLKIPIQYTKRVAGAPQSSYLPIKVNAAGVIPVIFASSITSLFGMFVSAGETRFGGETWFDVLATIFNFNTIPGGILYLILIVAFTFFYAFVQVNPEKLAENLQKQGSYIPSVRPGKGTETYISEVLMRLSTVGAIFLGVISITPIIAQNLFDLPKAIGLGGTSLLIVIGVAIETMKQLEGLLLKRNYVGFIRE